MPSKCPEGQIRRKAYTRKDGTFVKSTCVKDRGLPGKTPLKRRSLPIPVKGALGKYGYSNIAKTLARDRREALLKGVKDTDYATIIRRINLIANYNKNSNPQVFKRIKSDITWMQKQLAPTYAKSYKKASKELTVVELKQLCRDKGIKGYSKLNKDELIKKCNSSK